MRGVREGPYTIQLLIAKKKKKNLFHHHYFFDHLHSAGDHLQLRGQLGGSGGEGSAEVVLERGRGLGRGCRILSRSHQQHERATVCEMSVGAFT